MSKLAPNHYYPIYQYGTSHFFTRYVQYGNFLEIILVTFPDVDVVPDIVHKNEILNFYN